MARALSPRGEVVLRERRDPDDGSPGVLELRVNGVFVMDTRETSSERGLATAALAEVEDPRAVLVGGLGLGYTAHEVLADRRVERLVVVEIEEDLVRWMRDGTVPHGPALPRRRAAQRGRRRRRGRRSPRRPGVVRPGAARRRQRPGVPCPRRQRGALPGRVPRRRADGAAPRRRGGGLVGGPGRRARGGDGGGVRRASPRCRTTSGSRTATSSTGSTCPDADCDRLRWVACRAWTHTAPSTTAWARSRCPRDALWRAQTQRAVENFPISGTHPRGRARPGARPGQGRRRAGQRRARRHHRRAGRGDPRPPRRRSSRASTTTTSRSTSSRPARAPSSNMNMNEVLASLAAAGRGRGAPQRPRQRQPVQQRHLPDLDPRRGDARRPTQRPGAGAGPPRAALEAKAEEFADDREVRPHPPDGRDAGDARPGARRLRRDRAARRSSGSRRRSPGWPSCPSAARRSAPASTPPPASPPRVIAELADDDRAAVHRGPQPLRGAGRPATRSSSCPASCARSRSASPRSATTCAGCRRARRPGLAEIHLPDLQPGSSIMPGKVNPVLPGGDADGVRPGHRQRRGGRRPPAPAAASSST